MDSVFEIWSSIWNEKLSLKLPTKCLLEALSSPKILKYFFTFFVNFIFSGHWENILPGGGQWGTGRVLFERSELPELLDSAGERISWLSCISCLQCGCGLISCPCCNLLMNLEMTTPKYWLLGSQQSTSLVWWWSIWVMTSCPVYWCIKLLEHTNINSRLGIYHNIYFKYCNNVMW